jgi:hypothetical protein
MKKLFLVLAVAGYMSACAPTSNTTSSTGTVEDNQGTESSSSSDANTDTSTSGTTGTDSNTSSGTTGTTNSSDMDTADKTDQSATNMPASGTTSETDVMGSSTTITMDQLPKAVRDAYMKMPGHDNATGIKVYQVKTSEHPVLYKIEGTSGSTNYVHHFTPEGTEVHMSDH